MVYKKLKFGFGFLIALLMISPLVSAFGVTAPYWDGNPLILYPGQTKDFALILQNMVSSEDVKLKAEIIEGSEIATLTDSNLEYIIPPRRKDIKVNLRAEIPETTPLNKEYRIEISFKQISLDEGKMVQMTSGVEKYIPVIIKSQSEVLGGQKETPKTEEKISPIITIILFLVIILIIVGYIIFKRKKK